MHHLRLASLSLFLIAASLAPAQTVSNFVTLTPCRIADTRDPSYSNGNLGPPFMPAHSTRDFAVLSSSCNVPSTAIAYSLNITIVPRGPVLYLSIWPTGQPQPVVSTLNSPGGAILANAATVPAGANGAITIYSHGDTDVLIDINGYYTAYTAPVIPPPVNTTVVQQVTLPTILPQSNSGQFSLAVGTGTSSEGSGNTALGANALAVNTSGNNNVAIGSAALMNNASGSANIAIGTHALLNNGIQTANVAVGFSSQFSSVNGHDNTSLGMNSLFGNNIGSNNIAIGSGAGYNVAHDQNIEIGNAGTANDAYTIRLGTQGTQTTTYIAGIAGTALAGATQVYVTTSGQLGFQPSSRRYKDDIQPLTDESDKLLQLRPVRFRYKQTSETGDKPIQYGLIAEEVADVYPELVLRNTAGQAEAVQYQLLPALLLKQIQKQQQTIDELKTRLQNLEAHSK